VIKKLLPETGLHVSQRVDAKDHTPTVAIPIQHSTSLTEHPDYAINRLAVSFRDASWRVCWHNTKIAIAK
jgi:hypothetical protein